MLNLFYFNGQVSCMPDRNPLCSTPGPYIMRPHQQTCTRMAIGSRLRTLLDPLPLLPYKLVHLWPACVDTHEHLFVVACWLWSIWPHFACLLEYAVQISRYDTNELKHFKQEDYIPVLEDPRSEILFWENRLQKTIMHEVLLVTNNAWSCMGPHPNIHRKS